MISHQRGPFTTMQTVRPFGPPLILISFARAVRALGPDQLDMVKGIQREELCKCPTRAHPSPSVTRRTEIDARS